MSMGKGCQIGATNPWPHKRTASEGDDELDRTWPSGGELQSGSAGRFMSIMALQCGFCYAKA